MGRKTHESIGKTLPGRRNIVISQNAHFKPAQGCELAGSLNEAIALLKNETEIMVIGGGKIYEQALPLAKKLYITNVHHSFVGDVRFPTWSPEKWVEISREKRLKDAENAYDMTFLVLALTENI
jgi:dihydrofolate reductase